MVPDRAGLLVVRVLVDIGLTRQDGELRLAVDTRRHMAAVQVGADALGVAPVVGAVRTGVHFEDVAATVTAAVGRQVVLVGHLDRLALGGHDGG